MIIAIDLDGTTVPSSGHPSAATISALQACQRAGHRVIIATGRTFRNAVAYAEQFEVEGPMICAHGADVYASRAGTRLWTTPVDVVVAQLVLEQCAEIGLPVLMHCEDGRAIGVVPKHGPGLAPYMDLNPAVPVVSVSLEEAVATLQRVPVLKVVGVGGASAVARRTYAWQARFGEVASVVRSMACFVEVTAPLATKGAALARLMQEWQMPASEVVAFGDSENDVSMLQWAGRSYAPATAMRAAQRAAKGVMPSVDEDGVAVVLRQLGLLA